MEPNFLPASPWGLRTGPLPRQPPRRSCKPAWPGPWSWPPRAERCSKARRGAFSTPWWQDCKRWRWPDCHRSCATTRRTIPRRQLRWSGTPPRCRISNTVGTASPGSEGPGRTTCRATRRTQCRKCVPVCIWAGRLVADSLASTGCGSSMKMASLPISCRLCGAETERARAGRLVLCPGAPSTTSSMSQLLHSRCRGGRLPARSYRRCRCDDKIVLLKSGARDWTS